MPSPTFRSALAAALVALLALAGAGAAEPGTGGCRLFPETRMTIGGDYRVSVTRCPTAIPVETPTFWTFRISSRSRTPFAGRVEIAGGMPDHGHGFLTAPVVTRMQPGVFRVRLVFAMRGRWVAELRIGSARKVVRYTISV